MFGNGSATGRRRDAITSSPPSVRTSNATTIKKTTRIARCPTFRHLFLTLRCARVMRGCSRCACEDIIRVRSLGEITRVFGVVHARADPRLDVHRLVPCVIAVRGAARQHRYCSPAIIAAVDPWTDRSRRTASASHPTSSSRCAARPPPPPSSTRPPPLDGDIQQVSEPSLGVSPCPSYPTRGAPCLERGPRADARPPGLFSL